jgi:hypothetical protein
MIETFLLDDDTQSKLEKAHSVVLPHRKKTFDTKSYWKHNTSNNYDILGNDRLRVTYDVLQLSFEILENLEIYNYDPNYFLIDYHQLNSSDTKRPYSPFVWHVDDYGTMPYNTHTIIFYLRKDRSLKGGNLLYLDKSLPDDYDDYNKINLFNTCVQIKNKIVNYLQPIDEKKIRKKKIVGKEAIYFPGNMLHNPEPVYGFGCRDTIVVFIKRTKNKETRL